MALLKGANSLVNNISFMSLTNGHLNLNLNMKDRHTDTDKKGKEVIIVVTRVLSELV